MVERAARHHRDHLVALAHPRALDRTEPAHPLDPAVARQHHVGVLADDVRLLVELQHVLVGGHARPPAVAKLFADRVELPFHHAPQPHFRLQDRQHGQAVLYPKPLLVVRVNGEVTVTRHSSCGRVSLA